MKNFLLLCIALTFTSFTGFALAVPPPPHYAPHHCAPHHYAPHHYAHHHNYSRARYNNPNRPTVYYNQTRFTVYGNSPNGRYTPSYCLTRNNSNDINCNRGKVFIPAHTSPLYGF